MLKFTLMAARNILAVSFLAVFLSSTGNCSDHNLTSVGEEMSSLIYDLSRSIVSVETLEQVYACSERLPVSEAVQKQVTTGLICDSSGHVLVPAKSVVGHDQIAVSFGDKSYPAAIVGIDYQTDLALLRTDRQIGTPVVFSENQICAGQMVIDLAHSEGLRASPTIGFCAGSRLDGNLQFALPVSPESIGGGVFDLSGKLLGIVVAGVGENRQIAQAVPGYRLQAIINHLKTLGDRPAGFIGITSVEIEIYPPLDLPPLSRVDLKPGQTLDRGVIVTDIVPGSSAEMAGIRTGDLIYSYDNQLVSSAIDLANWVKQTPPGRMVIVDVLRHASHFQVQMRIGSKELAPTVANARLASGGDANSRLVDSLRTELARLRTNINIIEKELQRVSQ